MIDLHASAEVMQRRHEVQRNTWHQPQSICHWDVHLDSAHLGEMTFDALLCSSDLPSAELISEKSASQTIITDITFDLPTDYFRSAAAVVLRCSTPDEVPLIIDAGQW